MKEIGPGKNKNTRLFVTDETGHVYKIAPFVKPTTSTQDPVTFAEISFQKGGREENGVNGCCDEDLLNVVIDRLQSFQKGLFPHDCNAHALRHIKIALDFLDERTSERKRRGVEGLMVP